MNKRAKQPVSWSRTIKIIFPALYGLLNYASIRLVNDVISEMRFWERPWQTNLVEILASILVSYPFAFVCRLFIRRLSKYSIDSLLNSVLIREFLVLLLCVEGLVIVLLFPLAAFTDDGLQWYDVVNLSLIPILYWMVYFALSVANMMLRKNHEQQLLLEKISRDKLQTELQFLRAQFHPHFLFNALNTVYFQIDEKNSEAKYTVEKLSELLRYQLYDQEEKVLLSDELKYLQSYIDLQKQRMEEQLVLEVTFHDQWNGRQIYPLLLLPLVENAFKYVGGEFLFINISIRLNENQLQIEVINSIPVLHKLISQKKGGIGLDNLRKRLDLLYPQHHFLEIRKEENKYTASLTIEL